MNILKKGFTLTEILTVLAIISIIAIIAVPSVIVIRNRINSRAYESKKELIILAAELYGQDNKALLELNGEISTTVGDLLEKDYLEKDIAMDGQICSSSYGCIMDPRNNTSLNDIVIVVKLNNGTVKAIWEGVTGSSSERDLVQIVLTDLSCTPTETSPCLYTGEETNNYLSYSGTMWRILGVYVIDGTNVVKMITNENIY